MADQQTKKLVNPLENELPHLHQLYDELLKTVEDATDQATIRVADELLEYIKDLKTGMLREIAEWATEYKDSANERLAAAA